MVARESDPFGAAITAAYRGDQAFEIVERDDGHIDASPADRYLTPATDWPAIERTAVNYVEGRVLDVGCGPGRHAVYLQNHGHDVVGLDVSPGALHVARERGLDHTVRSDIVDLDAYDGTPFDTVCMFGHNFGLVGTRNRAPAVFDALDAVTTPDARIIASSNDPYATTAERHLAYHERNRVRGRLPGALRIRIRYHHARTPWFDYLLASPTEMADIASENGWTLVDRIDDEGSSYIGVLEKNA